MKQVININFHGQVVPIEASAFDLLKNYTASLSKHFEMEQGKEEIINDIESRIGELFQQRLAKGATCITDEDVNAIIQSIGRPEEFDSEEEYAGNGAAASKNTYSNENAGKEIPKHKKLYRDENNKVLGGVCSGIANYFGTDTMIIRIIFVLVALFFGTGVLAYIIVWIAVPSSSIKEIGGTRKKLFRDPDDKIIAGVGSGLGNYFGVNPWIPRVFFLLPFLSFVFKSSHWNFMDSDDFFNFSFSPGALLAYIIFWLVLPEANTTTEKLEMKGEKVDMNSIKNSVMNEMKGVSGRVEKFGQEAKSFAEEKGTQMGAEIRTVAKKGGRSLGDVIVFIAKIFAYFIIGAVSFALVMALFSVAILSIGVFPFKEYVLTDGWQNILAWGTLLFFIAVPVVGVITWIIRRLAKMKSNRKVLRASFISLWVVGWVCFICMLASITKDFRAGNNSYEQDVALSNPMVGKLEITNHSSTAKFLRNKWLRFEPFNGIDEDSAMVNNIDIKIMKSTNDSFRVTLIKIARGSNRRFADTLANKIQFNVQQMDSVLLLDKGFVVTKKDKFRNQKLIMIVYVPMGKQIKINKGIGYGFGVHFGDDFDENFMDMSDEERNWEENVDYVMKADGLYTLDGKPARDYHNEGGKRVRVRPNGIEIRDGNKKVTIDDDGVNVDEGKDNYRYDNNAPINRLDSLQLKLESEKKQAKDSLQKAKENIERQLEKIETNKKQEPTAMTSNRVMLINPVTGFL